MKKILAFAGSNSSVSINQKLATYAASQVSSDPVDVISLRDFEMPIYSHDYEESQGIPDNTKKLNEVISKYDGLMISVNEHNGGLSAFFKNCMDWLSRNDRNFLVEKKLFILSASPGQGAGSMANDYAVKVLPRFGAQVVSSFCFASFDDNFTEKDGITDNAQYDTFKIALDNFLKEIK